MRAIFLFTAFLFLSLLAKGQIAMFQKTYGTNHYDGGKSIHQTIDGGYIIAGFNNTGGGKFYLLKLNSNGDTLLTKKYGNTDYSVGLNAWGTSDGGYVIAGNSHNYTTAEDKILLIRTKANGDTLWTKTYGTTEGNYLYDCQQTLDGGYVFCGFLSTPNKRVASLVKVDSSGSLEWAKQFGTSASITSFSSVKETAAGGFIATGENSSGSSGTQDVFVVKTDSNGNLLWNKLFGGTGDEHGTCILETPDGGDIITGITYNSFISPSPSIYLLKITSSGSLTWSKTIGKTGIPAGGNYISNTSDGGYIISGEASTLTKVDANGSFLWAKQYNGWSFIRCAHETIDGGFIAIGEGGWTGNDSGNVFVAKTDINGNTGCNELNISYTSTTPPTTSYTLNTTVNSGFSLGKSTINAGSGTTIGVLCSNVSVNYPAATKISINISPNPFLYSAELVISNYPTQAVEVIMELYDVFGRRVRQTQIEHYQTTIKKDNLTSGVYFYKIFSDSQAIITGKIIIE